MMKRQYCVRAFTLVELLVVAGVFFIMASLMVSGYKDFASTLSYGSAYNQVHRLIRKTVHMSKQNMVPGAISVQSFSLNGYSHDILSRLIQYDSWIKGSEPSLGVYFNFSGDGADRFQLSAPASVVFKGFDINNAAHMKVQGYYGNGFPVTSDEAIEISFPISHEVNPVLSNATSLYAEAVFKLDYQKMDDQRKVPLFTFSDIDTNQSVFEGGVMPSYEKLQKYTTPASNLSLFVMRDDTIGAFRVGVDHQQAQVDPAPFDIMSFDPGTGLPITSEKTYFTAKSATGDQSLVLPPDSKWRRIGVMRFGPPDISFDFEFTLPNSYKCVKNISLNLLLFVDGNFSGRIAVIHETTGFGTSEESAENDAGGNINSLFNQSRGITNVSLLGYTTGFHGAIDEIKIFNLTHGPSVTMPRGVAMLGGGGSSDDFSIMIGPDGSPLTNPYFQENEIPTKGSEMVPISVLATSKENFMRVRPFADSDNDYPTDSFLRIYLIAPDGQPTYPLIGIPESGYLFLAHARAMNYELMQYSNMEYKEKADGIERYYEVPLERKIGTDEINTSYDAILYNSFYCRPVFLMTGGVVQ